jgi:hypothetical protein
MGDLLKEIKTERVNTGGRKSLLDVVLDGLSEEDRVDVLKAVSDPSVSATAISTVLTRRGHRVAPSVIANWRKRNGIV